MSAPTLPARLACACFGAALGLSLCASPGAFADGPSMGPDAGGSLRTPPDPPPLRERTQYLVDLRWVRGEVYLISMRPTTLAEPRESPRVMGRFALELYEGGTLVERVRFDFPLLGAVDAERGARLAPKLSTRVGVMFPAIARGTHFELWDRATDTRWPIPWPAAVVELAPTSDAGADAARRADGGR